MTLFDQVSRQHYASPPNGWQTKRIKFVADVQTSNVDKISAEDEEPVKLCNYTDVYYNDRITADLPFMDATATSKEIKKFTLRAGQVLITKDSEGWDDIGIPAFVPDDVPGVLCGYHLAIFSPDEEQLDGQFLSWLCRADALNDQFKLSANGVTRFGLGQYAMKNAVVSYPALDAQRRIANFLDEKTTQIDALIAKKQALLEHLAEKRQTLLTQAVTKGRSPDARMKDSGINWLGEIPAHWEVKRLKFATSKIGSGVTPRGGASVYVDEGVMLLRSQNVHFDGLQLEDVAYIDLDTDAEMAATRVFASDVLLNITGASIGRCCVYDRPDLPANVNQHVCIVRPTPDVSREFLSLFLASPIGQLQIDLSQNGASREGLSFGDLGNFLMPLPNAAEQAAISDHTNLLVSKLKSQSTKINNSISALHEYRVALITAAVTGQIEELR